MEQDTTTTPAIAKPRRLCPCSYPPGNAPSTHGSTTPTSASAGMTTASTAAGAASAQQSQPGEEGAQKEAATAYTVPSKPKTAEEYEALSMPWCKSQLLMQLKERTQGKKVLIKSDAYLHAR
eukprot:1140485-Pelagomonas_calceolata.AAC.10